MKLPKGKATFYFVDSVKEFEAEYCIESGAGFMLENDVRMSETVVTSHRERALVAVVSITNLLYWLPK